jgi:hypothetical protein
MRKVTSTIKYFTKSFTPFNYHFHLKQHAESWATYQALFDQDKKEYFKNKVKLSQPHFGAKCENATHTPKSGKMESFGTPKNSEDDLRGQISSPWCVL